MHDQIMEEQQRAAQDPNTPLERLVFLARYYPENVSQNVMVPLYALEHPTLYVGLWRRLIMGWRHKLPDITEKAREQVALLVLEKVAPFWREYFAAHPYQIAKYQGEHPIRVENFDKALQLRRDYVHRKMVYAHYEIAVQNLRQDMRRYRDTSTVGDVVGVPLEELPLQKPTMVLNMAIGSPFPREQVTEMQAWQAEEIKREYFLAFPSKEPLCP